MLGRGLDFIENRGQWDGPAVFSARLGRDFAASLEPGGVALRLGGDPSADVRLLFEGASMAATLVGEQKRRGVYNFFLGNDRRRWQSSRPQKRPASDLQHVAGFLDANFERQAKPAGLRSIDTVRSRIKVLKRHLGEFPIKSLEDPAIINRFKSDSDYADEVEISTLHKVLATLRAAIHWGQAQTPPLIDKSPSTASVFG